MYYLILTGAVAGALVIGYWFRGFSEREALRDRDRQTFGPKG